MRTESVPFSLLPRQSKLFLDHQHDATALRQFYPTGVRSPFDVVRRVEDVLSNYKADRNKICDFLERTALELGAGPETFANIELLRDPSTVAVLTGQQTGLFTGPLYSIFKALTAIRMSECLRSRGIKAVPLFWMATEDHDLPEVSKATVIDSENKLFEANFVPERTDQGLQVGKVRLNGSIPLEIDKMFSRLPSTEFSGKLKEELSETWQEGKSFGSAFGKFLVRLLGKYGIILVDPLDRGLKRAAAPIYIDAIRRSREIAASLTRRGEELSVAGYQPQVLIEGDYFPLFFQTDNGVRTALRRGADGHIKAKGRPESFSEDEVVEIAAADPGRLSPGVMLRPVVQDHLFPTICYFGGSAEVAYFAQNSEVYRILDRPVTPILHRQSLTVIEPKHARTLERYGLTFSDLFKGEDAIIRRVIDEFVDPGTAGVLMDAEEGISKQLDRIDEVLSRLDPTLAANLATRRRKIAYHLGALRKKYYSRRAETEEAVDRRIKATLTGLLPGAQLQERELNVISFLDRFGPGFVDWIYDSIDLDEKGHRLVFI